MVGSNIDERYFEWLTSRFMLLDEDLDQLCMMLSVMQDFTFLPIKEEDTNRWEDGVHLRVEFAESVAESDCEADYICETLDHILGGCTMLELLVTLAERIAYEMVGSPYEKDISEWVIELLSNAGLLDYTNERMMSDEQSYFQVSDILEKIVFRKYYPNGDGGFFPLNESDCQRDRELIDQMNYYISENYNLLN